MEPPPTARALPSTQHPAAASPAASPAPSRAASPAAAPVESSVERDSAPPARSSSQQVQLLTAPPLPSFLEAPTENKMQCPFCSTPFAVDLYGDHVLSCVSGGHKTLMHNDVVDVLAFNARKARMQPHLEPAPFVRVSDGSVFNRRADILIRPHGAGIDAPIVSDVAITHFATEQAIKNKWSSTPHGAANTYEERVKRPKYDIARISQGGDDVKLGPQFGKAQFQHCVYDSLGAPGESAVKFIGHIVRGVASTTSQHPSVVARELHQRLSFHVARHTAKRLVIAYDSVNTQLDRQHQLGLSSGRVSSQFAAMAARAADAERASSMDPEDVAAANPGSNAQPRSNVASSASPASLATEEESKKKKKQQQEQQQEQEQQQQQQQQQQKEFRRGQGAQQPSAARTVSQSNHPSTSSSASFGGTAVKE
jgi:hypothetical protein